MDGLAPLLKLSHLLRTAFADPTVRAARAFEMGGIAVIVALMVLKPF